MFDLGKRGNIEVEPISDWTPVDDETDWYQLNESTQYRQQVGATFDQELLTVFEVVLKSCRTLLQKTWCR